MASVFDLRKTGFLWWGLIAALVFLIPPPALMGTANYIRRADWLQPNQPPLSWVDDLRKSIDTFATAFPGMIQFKPDEALVRIGPLQIPNLAIGIVVGVLLLVIAFTYYRMASASRGVLDDLLAMLFIYVVLRVEGAATSGIPLVKEFNDRAPLSYLLVLVSFMVYQLIRGRGAKDSSVFFKVLLELILVSILILPRQTLDALAWAVEFPAKVHDFLANTQYFVSAMAVWAVLGLILAVVNLYTISRPAATVQAGAGESAAPRRESGRAQKKTGG